MCTKGKRKKKKKKKKEIPTLVTTTPLMTPMLEQVGVGTLQGAFRVLWNLGGLKCF